MESMHWQDSEYSEILQSGWKISHLEIPLIVWNLLLIDLLMRVTRQNFINNRLLQIEQIRN